MKIKARIIIFITLMFLIMIAVAAYGASIVVQSMTLNMPMKSAAAL